MSKPTGIDITPETLKGIFHSRRYFAQALDPIHVGTGGERLSRVDMAIVREAGTDLPKLPGTSLSGACRAYAALQQNGDGRYCAGSKGESYTNTEGQAIKEHCGKLTCPICQTFGYVRGDNGGKKGTAQFADAHIIAFPVASTNGPIWVTSQGALQKIGLKPHSTPGKDFVPNKDVVCLHIPGAKVDDTIGLGWLALPIKAIEFDLAGEKVAEQRPYLDDKPLALVSDTLFSTFVNDNLEVRTSVAINPGTGAAEDGALFTYEAIPTGTLFAFDITYQREKREVAKTTAEQGLDLFAWLGVGGMNTRGMGRLRVLDMPQQGEQK